MPNRRLTDFSIRSLPVPASGQTTYWDDAVSGFGVRVSQGGTRSFVLVNGHDRKRHTIGRYPTLSLADARAEAKRIIAQLTLGTHPVKTSSFDDGLRTFLAMCEQRNKPGTAKEYARLLRRHFLPVFDRRSLGEITTRDVSRVLDHLVSAPSECFHATVAVKIFFRWAAQRGLIRDNPCEHLRPATKSTPRDRALADIEQAKVICAAKQFGFPFGTIVLLLALTGQRRGEIAALQWQWIDHEARTITLPASLTKNKRKHTFPYGQRVADILDAIPRQGDLLFPARGRPDVPYSGWSKNKITLDRVCQIELWTLHDLHRTFATNLAALSTPPHIVEKLLNHASGTISGVAAVYNRHAYMDEMRAAIDAWEKRLSYILAQHKNDDSNASSLP